MGKFDVDLQIRISQEEFDGVVAWMKLYAEEKNTEHWTEQYAVFKDKKDIIDYNITVIDSRHDMFHLIRDYLIDHPPVLQKYMELKLSFQGKTYGEYRPVRYEFFKKIRAILAKPI